MIKNDNWSSDAYKQYVKRQKGELGKSFFPGKREKVGIQSFAKFKRVIRSLNMMFSKHNIQK